MIGLSDPRREKYFPGMDPGVEINLTQLPGIIGFDLFFIAPFYHTLLLHLDQLIVVDLDVEFR